MNTNAIFGHPWGRLGNQIFQVALLFAISQRLGHDFYLRHDGEPLWDCFDLDIPAGGPDCTHRFDEVNGSCNYDPGVFEQPDGTSYYGYFQSYRYVEDYKPALVQFLRFRFKYRALSEAVLFACRRRYRAPLVSLHVRRDDYLNPGNIERFGDLAAEGYYDRVVKEIGDDVTYLVFSDDLDWCRRSLQLERMEFVGLDHCTSLCLMTRCDVNVVANSSFSWWGAYLNPNGDVYAPSRWFGPATPPPNEVQNDIVPPAWRTIPCFGDTTAEATNRSSSDS
jgi:hypothetical protein